VEPLKVGGYSLSERLSFYLAVQPAGCHFAQHPGSDIGFLLDSVSSMKGAGIVLFAAVGLAGGSVIGYLSRELAFWITVMIWAAILTSLLRLRDTELWQSLRNLAFDTMMRAAHIKLQESAEADPGRA
jgi:hypothetical protein